MRRNTHHNNPQSRLQPARGLKRSWSLCVGSLPDYLNWNCVKLKHFHQKTEMKWIPWVKITPLCLIVFFFVLPWLPAHPVASAVIFMSFCHVNIKMFSHSVRPWARRFTRWRRKTRTWQRPLWFTVQQNNVAVSTLHTAAQSLAYECS